MLVTEFMELGDLYRALQADDKPGNRRFSWYRTSPAGERTVNGLSKRIALDVVRGLAFLHSRNIVHFGGPLLPVTCLGGCPAAMHTAPCTSGGTASLQQQ